MHNHPPGHTSAAPSHYEPGYPLHKVVAALAGAGLAGDRIEIVTATDESQSEEPIGGAGNRGCIERRGLNLGDDLDALEQARSELRQGHTLTLVAVHNDTERQRARYPARARRPLHARLRPLDHHYPRRGDPLAPGQVIRNQRPERGAVNGAPFRSCTSVS